MYIQNLPTIYTFLNENKNDNALNNWLKLDSTKDAWKSIGLDGFKFETSNKEQRTVDLDSYLSMRAFLRHAVGIISDNRYRKYQQAIARLWIETLLTKDAEKEASFESDITSVIKSAVNGPDDNFNLSGKPMNQLLSEYNQQIKSANRETLDKIKDNHYDSKTDYKIVEIHDFDEASEYYKYVSDLNIPWCVTQSSTQFSGYSAGGSRRIYFALKNGFDKLKKPNSITEDTPYDEYGMSMMFISIEESGMISNITSRWNHDASLPKKESKWHEYGNSDTHYFEKDGEYDTDLLSNMFGGNFYDIFKPKSFKEILKVFNISEDTPDDCSFYIKRNSEDFFVIVSKETDKPLYDEIYKELGGFSDGFATVYRQDDKVNLIDKKGSFLSDEWFCYAGNFSNGFVKVKNKDERWNFINKEGKLISKEWFPYVWEFSDGFAKVGNSDARKWNFINTEGEPISKDWFCYADDFYDGFALVRNEAGKWNFINKEGNLISKDWFFGAYRSCDGFARVKTQDKKCNFINKEGNLISKDWFSDADNFYDGFARVKTQDKKWNFINTEGNLISKDWFSDADDFYDGFARVKTQDGEYYYIASDGKLYSEPVKECFFVEQVPLLHEFLVFGVNYQRTKDSLASGFTDDCLQASLTSSPPV